MECVKIWFGLKTVGWLWFMLSAGHSRSHTKEILPFGCSSANFRLCTVENSGRSPGQLCAGRAIIRWEGWSLHRHLCVLLSFLEWHLALSLSSFHTTKKLSCIHFTSLAIGCETKAKLSLREILLSFGICFNFWFAGKDRIGSSWRCQDKAPKGAIWSILTPLPLGGYWDAAALQLWGQSLGVRSVPGIMVAICGVLLEIQVATVGILCTVKKVGQEDQNDTFWVNMFTFCVMTGFGLFLLESASIIKAIVGRCTHLSGLLNQSLKQTLCLPCKYDFF